METSHCKCDMSIYKVRPWERDCDPSLTDEEIIYNKRERRRLQYRRDIQAGRIRADDERENPDFIEVEEAAWLARGEAKRLDDYAFWCEIHWGLKSRTTIDARSKAAGSKAIATKKLKGWQAKMAGWLEIQRRLDRARDFGSTNTEEDPLTWYAREFVNKRQSA